MKEAQAACLCWLATREHTRAELAHKLKSHGFDDTVIAFALQGLEADGLQSDRRFAEAFVRNRFAKGHGPQRIRQELRWHGFEPEEQEEYLTGYDWDQSLEKVHGKKFGGAPPANPKEFAARVRFLSQRGFEQDRIQALFRRLRQGEH